MTLKNHVVNAKRALELSKLDQENLRLKIEAWLKDSPQSTHYFRPYIKKSQGSSQNSCLQEAIDTHTVGTFVGNTGSEGKGTKLSDTSEECTQTLLLNLLCSLNQLMKQLMFLQLSGSGIVIGLHHSL